MFRNLSPVFVFMMVMIIFMTACGAPSATSTTPAPTSTLEPKTTVDFSVDWNGVATITINTFKEGVIGAVEVYTSDNAKSTNWHQIFNAKAFAFDKGENVIMGKWFDSEVEIPVKLVVHANDGVTVTRVTVGGGLIYNTADEDFRDITCGDNTLTARIRHGSQYTGAETYGMALYFENDTKPYITFTDIMGEKTWVSLPIPADHKDWHLISFERDGYTERGITDSPIVYCKK